MEVTADNFDGTLPEVQRALEACDFVAFDLEMTGLHVAGQGKPTQYDTAHDRYASAAESARNFLPIQFGLCTFTWNPTESQFEAKPFNFFLFPKPLGRNSRTFLCEVGSVKFLRDNAFDFNKLFAEGVPYASRVEEVGLRAPRGQSNITLTGKDAVFYAETCARIQDWLDNTTAKMLELPPCNSYLLRALYQELPGEFDGLTLASRNGDGYSKIMTVSRLSQEEREEQARKKTAEQEKSVREKVGFRLVIDSLIAAQKPLVGHNMLLDLCHLYHSFLGPLPDSAEQFQAELHGHFPVIFDTKYFGSYCHLVGQEFRNTALDHLYGATRTQARYAAPLVEFARGFVTYTSESEKCHEAAFDAFCTGFVFIKLSHFVLAHGSEGDSVTPANDVLSQWANKVYLARSSVSFDMISLAQVPKHHHVFYVSDFAESVTTSDLLDWFSFAEKGSVSWKTSTSAFVSLQRTILTEEEILARAASIPDCSVIGYEEYLEVSSGRKQRLAGRKRTRREEEQAAPSAKRAKKEEDSGFASSCTIM